MNLPSYLLQTSPQKLIAHHVVLGFLSLVSKYFVIAWIWWCLKELWKFRRAPIADKIIMVAYIAGLEILGRMTKTSPFVPYEMGKYLLIASPFIFGLTHRIRFGMLLLLVPGILLAFIEGLDFLLYVFHLFGWVAFIFFTGVTDKITLTATQLNRLLLALILGATAAVFLSFFKAPDISEIEFSLDANRQTSGGYAPNQVATTFGLGIGVLGIMWFLGMQMLPRWLLLSLLGFFMFRGILTFSRGGIAIGILAILAVFLIDVWKNNRARVSKIIYLLFFALATLLIVFQINQISDGLFFKRLSGETIGTHYGVVEKDLNTATSGRFLILLDDIDLLLAHPIFGVGVHQSTLLRPGSRITGDKVVSHVELTRLLSEHALLGIIFFIGIHLMFFRSWSRQPGLLGKCFVIFCFVFSIGTTYHSGTRTFVTPLLGGLAMLIVSGQENFKRANRFENKSMQL